jgi:hypothetical protein
VLCCRVSRYPRLSLLDHVCRRCRVRCLTSRHVVMPCRCSDGIELRDLQPIAMLGEGAFGTVRLVRHLVRFDSCLCSCVDATSRGLSDGLSLPARVRRAAQPTSALYALKMMQKTRIVEMGQQRNVVMEKNIMMRAKHPYVRGAALWCASGGGDTWSRGRASDPATVQDVPGPRLPVHAPRVLSRCASRALCAAACAVSVGALVAVTRWSDAVPLSRRQAATCSRSLVELAVD